MGGRGWGLRTKGWVRGGGWDWGARKNANIFFQFTKIEAGWKDGLIFCESCVSIFLYHVYSPLERPLAPSSPARNKRDLRKVPTTTRARPSQRQRALPAVGRPAPAQAAGGLDEA